MEAAAVRRRLLLAVLCGGALIRFSWWLVLVGHPSSDDVLLALMAESVSHGKDFSFVQWRVGYGGTIGTAWVLAGLFRVFGPSLALSLAYAACLSLLQVWLWASSAERLQPGAGLWTGLLLAFPPPCVLSMSQALCYVEFLTIGAGFVWVVARLKGPGILSRVRSFGLGCLAGYLLYTYPLAVCFAAGLLALWRMRLRASLPWAMAGFAAGISPLAAANLSMNWVTFRRIGSRILNMTAADFSEHASVLELAQRLATQCGIGLRDQGRLAAEVLSSEQGWLLVGIPILLGLAALLFHARRASVPAKWLAWPIILAAAAGNVLLGQNARARYLTPAYQAASLLAGVGAGAGGVAACGFITIVGALNVWQHGKQVRLAGPPVPYRQAIRFLRERNLRYGYADYWTSLPLTFLSHTDIVTASTATDARQVYDRTVHLTAQVDRSPSVFYVFRTDQPFEQPYAAALDRLAEQGACRFRRDEIPPFALYWDLSRPVRPAELEAARQAGVRQP